MADPADNATHRRACGPIGYILPKRLSRILERLAERKNLPIRTYLRYLILKAYREEFDDPV